MLIADDQPEVRSALRLIVGQQRGFRVTGEAGDAAAMLASCAALLPDVVLLDWELPGERAGGFGGGALDALRAFMPGVRIVALSVRHDARAEAAAAGVDAFVGKSEPPSRLIEVLEALRRR